MSLSEQERECVTLLCGDLSQRFGGDWVVQEDLDDKHPNEPSPEVRVTNGHLTAAIEAKRLVEHPELHASVMSNERYLTPSCGGYYTLVPPFDVPHRLPRDVRQHVKEEIERIAPALTAQGEPGGVRLPQHGYVVFRPAPVFRFSCSHGAPLADLAAEIGPLVPPGIYMLVDSGCRHEFVTPDGRVAFLQRLVAACEAAASGEQGTLTWDDEWPLFKLEEGGDTPGVHVASMSEVFAVADLAIDSVDRVLKPAVAKFEGRRWADLHLIALDVGSFLDVDDVYEAIVSLAVLEQDTVQDVDGIYAVDTSSSRCRRCWPESSELQ